MPKSLKIVCIGAMVFLGVISGIVLGFRIIGKQNTVQAFTKRAGDFGYRDEMKLTFGPGDRFPLEEIVTVDSHKVSIQSLLRGRKTANMIVALGCDPCEEYFFLWNQIVTSKLKTGTNEIVLITHEQFAGSKQIPKYLESKLVFHVYRVDLETKINAVAFPTTMAIDEKGSVVQIQYGKQDGINYDILKFLTTHDI